VFGAWCQKHKQFLALELLEVFGAQVSHRMVPELEQRSADLPDTPFVPARSAGRKFRALLVILSKK
jgi:hypothetical protein